jgi:XTP/dITP diphosphohydrolase
MPQRLVQRLVLASNNLKKLSELQTLLQGTGFHLVTQGSLGIAEIEEPHPTFVENALAKARHASKEAKGPALADDSGLCVNALQGAPGVLSARYATLFGHAKSDANNNHLLIEQLARYPQTTQRTARFVCVLVAVKHKNDPEPLITFGRFEGLVIANPSGTNGFGYDPYFFIPTLNKTMAQLSPFEKNQLSHRALAAQQMSTLIKQVWQA